jgi:transcriptional regulator GlxA family with amidase domain
MTSRAAGATMLYMHPAPTPQFQSQSASRSTWQSQAPLECRGGAALAPWQERKAKALLAARMATDISVTEVARECRLSRSHFCKAFKQTTGQSPYAWLTRYRITTAQSLLRGTSQPLADIALACGFGDQSHLTRMFSRLVGTPPGSWRRALRG